MPAGEGARRQGQRGCIAAEDASFSAAGAQPARSPRTRHRRPRLMSPAMPSPTNSATASSKNRSRSPPQESRHGGGEAVAAGVVVAETELGRRPGRLTGDCRVVHHHRRAARDVLPRRPPPQESTRSARDSRLGFPTRAVVVVVVVVVVGTSRRHSDRSDAVLLLLVVVVAAVAFFFLRHGDLPVVSDGIELSC
ncbi:hypothetical protein ABZP36_008872 [Zizania latifolia]